MADKGLVIQVELFAILAKLNVTLIYVLILIPTYKFALGVFLLKNRQKRLLEAFNVEQRPGPPHEASQIAVQVLKVVGVLGLMFVLAIDGEIIELVHVLQKPEVIMQSLRLFLVLHDLADVEELHVNGMHVHVFSLVLLQTEVWLFKWCLEDVGPVVLNSIFRNHLP